MNHISENENEGQKKLAQMHSQKKRPLCPCREPAVEMYIAKVGDHYIVKRMPNTGSLHSPDCESYEPPPELSGLGEVMGSAIKENTEQGITELRFEFSMTRIPGRKPTPANSEDEPSSVKTAGTKLTLRSLLHYLWEQAGFHRWTPAMEGKRSWPILRKHLLQAAEAMIAKRQALSERLYIPEPFALEKKDSIVQRRNALFSKMVGPLNGPRQLILLVGEVKSISEARFGHKIVVKHAPDFGFMLNDDIYKYLIKQFQDVLELWTSMEDAHLIIVATFSVSQNGIASIEEMTLMPVTNTWIPFESVYDKTLIDTLSAGKRRFAKGLRYNLKTHHPLASLVLTDTSPQPTAMYVIPADANESQIEGYNALIEGSAMDSWVWHTEAFDHPEIPPAGPMLGLN